MSTTKKEKQLKNILLTVKVGLPFIITVITWFFCVHAISWSSAETSSASFWAGLLTNRHYDTNPIIYGIGDLRAYITGSFILIIATMALRMAIFAFEIWLLFYSYRTWRKNPQKTVARWKKEFFGKNTSFFQKFVTGLVLLFFLGTIVSSPFRIYDIGNEFAYNWENFAPAVNLDYDLIPVTVTNLSSERRGYKLYSYNSHTITVDIGGGSYEQFDIINHNVLEKDYQDLQIGQTIYAIRELQKNGTHKLLYLEDDLQDAEITFANYMK